MLKVERDKMAQGIWSAYNFTIHISIEIIFLITVKILYILLKRDQKKTDLDKTGR